MGAPSETPGVPKIEGGGVASTLLALLGLSIEQARELFVPANRSKPGYDHYTHPQDAARVVRYLAATDTVDWSVAGKL
jgi:hypothetical protein